MTEGEIGRKDAPKPRKPRKKAISLLRGYTDSSGISHDVGDSVSLPEKEARRLVEELGAAKYGPLD